MEKDLRNEVFEPSTVDLIEKIRFITGLHSLAKDVTKRGKVIVGAVNAKRSVEYTRAITSTLDNIPDDELKDSYKRFLCNLEAYAKIRDVKKITSMLILRDFLDSKQKLFSGGEIAMQAVICAAVKVSVESVVESLVSRYESHFTKSRHLEEKNALDEMMIAENGPSLFKADKVITNAMEQYWKSTSDSGSGKWHFLRESSTISLLDYGSNYGKTTRRLMNQPSKYPIMDS